MKWNYHIALITSVILTTIFSITAIFFPITGKIGATIWILLYILLAVYALRQLFRMIESAITTKTGILTLLTILALLIVFALSIADPRHISGETTNEVQCTVNHFLKSDDWGFASNCLFGYPARQFYISSIPTLLFGRSLLLLHVGTYTYLIISLVLFARGCLTYLSLNKRSDAVVASVLALVLHIHFFNHFMTYYEQSAFPFLFGLMCLGLLLSYIKTKNTEALIFFGLTLQFLIFTYTPGLALCALIVCGTVYTYLFVKETSPSQKKILIGIILITIINVGITFFTRKDLNFVSSDRSIELLLQDLLEGFRILFDPAKGTSLVSLYILGPFILFLLILITEIKNWKIPLIALWIFAICIISIVSVGYSFYDVNFRLHRATIIFPVLMTLLIYYTKRAEKPHPGLRPLILLVLVLFNTGLWNHYNYVNSRNTHIHYPMLTWLSQVEKSKSIMIDKLFFDAGANYEVYKSIRDTGFYFTPHTHMYSFEKRNCPDKDPYEYISSHSEKAYLIVHTSLYDSNCFVTANTSLVQIADYNEELTLYRITAD